MPIQKGGLGCCLRACVLYRGTVVQPFQNCDVLLRTSGTLSLQKSLLTLNLCRNRICIQTQKQHANSLYAVARS